MGMPDDRGHQLAQFLSVIAANLGYVLDHPTRQGHEVDDALREAIDANHQLSRMIRETLMERADQAARDSRPGAGKSKP